MKRIQKLFKKPAKFALKKISASAIKKFQPEVIAVTGSMGKTTTVAAIAHVLSHQFKTRTPRRSYNTEIGLPLAVIDEEVPYPIYSPIGWAMVIARGTVKLFASSQPGEKLVLEMGADAPGDISYLVGIAKPKVGVVTAVAPSHFEFFKSIEAVAAEKSKLVESLPADGVAVLNGDDPYVLKMGERTKAPVLTYGFKKTNDVVGSDWKLTPSGMWFMLKNAKNEVQVKSQVVGQHLIYPLLAAAAVGLYYGMVLSEIAEALETFEPPKGRMHPIKGLRDTWIIDDSYNASNPEMVVAALDTLYKMPAKRKIAALGTMNELGDYTELAHRKVGAAAARIADILVTVGKPAKEFLASEAAKKGMSPDRIFSFASSKEAGEFLRGILKKGDIVLVKGSQNNVRMEWAIEKIMADAHLAKKLLVRQGREWE